MIRPGQLWLFPHAFMGPKLMHIVRVDAGTCAWIEHSPRRDWKQFESTCHPNDVAGWFDRCDAVLISEAV